MFGYDEFIKIWFEPVLVSFVPNHDRKTIVCELLGNAANRCKARGKVLEDINQGNGDTYVLWLAYRTIAPPSHQTPLPPRSNETNRDSCAFIDQFLLQEFLDSAGKISLPRIRWKASRNE